MADLHQDSPNDEKKKKIKKGKKRKQVFSERPWPLKLVCYAEYCN